MATIHTVLSTDARHTPFTGGTDAQRLAQGAARGETRFVTDASASWAAPGAGNNRSLAVTVTLDRDFAWVLTDLSAIFILLNAGDTITMDAVAFTEIKLPVPGGYEYYYNSLVSNPSRQDTPISTAIGSIRADHYNTQYPILDVGSPGAMTFTPTSLPRYMLYPFDKTNNTINVTSVFSEGPDNQPAMTVRFSARFLQFDISQVYDWKVQSPQLTR